ncbi:MAG: ribosomal RNA small subunit methyltransferase A [Candidatus Stahlbacteria bacterium]|nr:ribosomal RNA small subunit methyltransferase A [Candidatus Stahlbacteria bacterium]
MKVKELIEEHSIVPRKSMGQNFLTSDEVAVRIVEECNIKTGDVVLEVGTGLGILTERILAYGVKVYGVEKDSVLYGLLVERYKGMSNLFLMCGNILYIRLSDFGYRRIKIVSNLPYSISSDFLYWVLENRGYVDSCVLTLQKEVAQRVYAKPGSKIYGSISVLVQYYMEINRLFDISGDLFYPSSKVLSQVIVLRPKECLSAIDEGVFFNVVHRVFAHRRKQLKNSLGLRVSILGGIDLSRRPEELSWEEFVRLSNAYKEREDER